MFSIVPKSLPYLSLIFLVNSHPLLSLTNVGFSFMSNFISKPLSDFITEQSSANYKFSYNLNITCFI